MSTKPQDSPKVPEKRMPLEEAVQRFAPTNAVAGRKPHPMFHEPDGGYVTFEAYVALADAYRELTVTSIPVSALLSDEVVEAGAKAAHELFGVVSWEETDPGAQATNRRAVRAVLQAAIEQVGGAK